MSEYAAILSDGTRAVLEFREWIDYGHGRGQVARVLVRREEELRPWSYTVNPVTGFGTTTRRSTRHGAPPTLDLEPDTAHRLRIEMQRHFYPEEFARSETARQHNREKLARFHELEPERRTAIRDLVHEIRATSDLELSAALVADFIAPLEHLREEVNAAATDEPPTWYSREARIVEKLGKI